MTLPSHLARWVSFNVHTSLLDESGLNCSGCTRYFGKCCTFQPYVANYNVGEKFDHVNYFSAPVGLLATHRYQQQHRATAEGERGADLLCSFYDLSSGSCGRWGSRPAECAAHFCESTHGERGTQFWTDFSADLNRMEVAVAQMAMVEFGFSPRAVGEQISWLVRAPEKFDPSLVWGDWFGEEKEFYAKCAQWSAGISREQVQEWFAEK